MVTFNVGNKVITDYQELILYISKLSSGTYNIIHNVSYNGSTIHLTQVLVIKDLVVDSGNGVDEGETSESSDSELDIPS